MGRELRVQLSLRHGIAHSVVFLWDIVCVYINCAGKKGRCIAGLFESVSTRSYFSYSVSFMKFITLASQLNIIVCLIVFIQWS
jgi:hypothetical protein